ncbi:MAG: hypothetical protein LQ346_007960 [Caloplaca aetnensis]|nr:MAG: hypothetical protein LQ346_007960 [Caloplaca aetnensis]
MSTPAPSGSGGQEEERKGLSKFVRRASKVFRRRSSARGSISGPSDLTQATSGAAAPQKIATPLASPPPIPESTIEEQPSKEPPAPIAAQPPSEQKTTQPADSKGAMTAAVYGSIQEERARALFAKYGLTLEPGEWTSPIKPDAERVEKKIRIRVHRSCHHCQAMFGPDKVCSNCKHTRCKKCPRFPAKKTKEKKDKGKGAAVAGGAIATTGAAAATIRETTLNLRSLTITSPATGRQVTYKPITQRRCPECPREPLMLIIFIPSPRPKTDKYPSGYPGDDESTGVVRERHPIRVHVRWTCHACSTTFKDLSKQCEGCGHDRCDECPRHPPKREKAKLDPDAVKSIEERMKTMGISPQASAA